MSMLRTSTLIHVVLAGLVGICMTIAVGILCARPEVAWRLQGSLLADLHGIRTPGVIYIQRDRGMFSTRYLAVLKSRTRVLTADDRRTLRQEMLAAEYVVERPNYPDWDRIVDAQRSLEVQFGFPFRSVSYSDSWGNSNNREYAFVTTTDDRREWAFAYRPLWSGLALNTLAYGLCWWCAIVGVHRAKHLVRSLRGRCVSCGYDLSGLPLGAPCPECGKGASIPKPSV